MLARLRRYLDLLLGAGALVGIDQLTKSMVRARLDFGEVWEPVAALAPFIRVIHWRNTGAAFGLFPDGGLFFTVIAILVVLAILYYYPSIPRGQRLLRVALALQLGGAIGNLLDRLARGPVTDFVAVGDFPVFNVADASISVGVVLLVMTMWLDERAEQRAAAVEAGEGALKETATEVERPVG